MSNPRVTFFSTHDYKSDLNKAFLLYRAKQYEQALATLKELEIFGLANTDFIFLKFLCISDLASYTGVAIDKLNEKYGDSLKMKNYGIQNFMK